MSKETYVLTLTHEQAQVVLDALELYARLRIGQFEHITEKLLDTPNVDEYCQRRDCANNLLRIVAEVIFDRDSRGFLDCCPDVQHRQLWGIYVALRFQMAWYDHPAGGAGVDFYPPMSLSGEPVPPCQVFRNGKECTKKTNRFG